MFCCSYKSVKNKLSLFFGGRGGRGGGGSILEAAY